MSNAKTFNIYKVITSIYSIEGLVSRHHCQSLNISREPDWEPHLVGLKLVGDWHNIPIGMNIIITFAKYHQNYETKY